MSKKTQGIVNRIITIGLWIFAFYLLFFTNFWYLAAGLFLLHLSEVFIVGYKKGTQAGYSPIYTVVMTLIFGFTWWLYLEEKK